MHVMIYKVFYYCTYIDSDDFPIIVVVIAVAIICLVLLVVMIVLLVFIVRLKYKSGTLLYITVAHDCTHPLLITSTCMCLVILFLCVGKNKDSESEAESVKPLQNG